MKCENVYEKAWWKEGRRHIVGLDEAGRGPLAGPLVVAAVMFPIGYSHEAIYDSKKVSEKKRERLFREIIEQADAYQIAIIEPKTIDEQNIYRATQLAMEDLVTRFQQADGVLSDAMPLPRCSITTIDLIKGDQKSVSIAAASILAKVIRDHIMIGYDHLYPQYGFARHKGYGTKEHLAALEKYGVLPIHRQSYAPVARLNQLQLNI